MTHAVSFFDDIRQLFGLRLDALEVAAFLFRQGEERHEQFAAPPFGVAFADTHDELLRKLGEPFATSLTAGLGSLAWAKWRVEGALVLHATYGRETTVRTFTIGSEPLPG